MRHEQKASPHLFSTIAALTEHRGRVTAANSGLTVIEFVIARVGDLVTNEDPGEAA
ncbi:protein of unknown function [Burkholderia multivorans]